MKEHLSTNEAAIAYLVEKLPGRLLKTQIVKLLFLADIEYWKQTGKQLTTFEYKFDHFGPYDQKNFDEAVGELQKANYLKETKVSKSTGGYYFLYDKGKDDFQKQSSEKIGSLGRAILDEITSQYGNVTLQSLLSIVYKHPLVTESERGQKLNFNDIPALRAMKDDLNADAGNTDTARA